MTIARLAALASMLALSVPASAQSWIEFLDYTDLFGVNFPHEPTIEETSYVSAFEGVFPARIFRADNERGRYSVTVVDYRDAERIHAERTDTTEASAGEWVKDVRASVAHAAWAFRRRGSEVTYDSWSDIERVEGHQLQLTNADQSRTFAGIYLHDSRLYILEATVAPGWPPPGQFQQSLRFIDEDGRRVRYHLDPDGTRTRITDAYEFGDTHSSVVENADEN